MSKSNLGDIVIHLPFYLNRLDFNGINVILHRYFWWNIFILKYVYKQEKKYLNESIYFNSDIISKKILFSIYVEKNNEIKKINITKITFLILFDLIKYPTFIQKQNIPIYNFKMSNLLIQSIKYKIEELI